LRYRQQREVGLAPRGNLKHRGGGGDQRILRILERGATEPYVVEDEETGNFGTLSREEDEKGE